MVSMATHIATLKKRLYLQNQAFVSSYLTKTIKLGTRLKLRHRSFITCQICKLDANYEICIFMIISQSFKNEGIIINKHYRLLVFHALTRQ